MPTTVKTQPHWYLIDATTNTMGRVASHAAQLLMGKQDTDYAPNKFSGHHVIIVNTQGVKLTGMKATDKLYHRHSGYLGNLKTFRFHEVHSKDATAALRLAIMGMLPKNKLRARMVRNLHLYAGDVHPHKVKDLIRYEVK